MAAGLLTQRQLRSSAWRRLFRDVYVHRDVDVTHAMRCRALALILTEGAAISRGSAAYLHGADVLTPDSPVFVTVGRHRWLRAPPGVRVSSAHLPESDVVVRCGVPLTIPIRTAFDLARTLDLTEAVVAVDALLERRLITLEGLRSYAEARFKWHGARRLEKVLTLAVPGAESPMETRLRLIVILGGLPAPRLQFPVRESLGRFAARLDLAYPERRLGVEYDGPSHWRPEAMRSDLRRQNTLRALGWTLLRFTADDVLKHPERVTAQVASALRS